MSIGTAIFHRWAFAPSRARPVALAAAAGTWLLLAAFAPVATRAFAAPETAASTAKSCSGPVCIDSLEQLTIRRLRDEDWNGKLVALRPTQDAAAPDSPNGNPSSLLDYMLSYDSDGLRLFARLELPERPAPASGFPLVLFLHGWAGAETAPGYDFAADKAGLYREIINSLKQAGFAVLTPGYRGHGTVAGQVADGIEFMHAWDTGSYLSPVFYARDVLNLMHALLPSASAESLQRVPPLSLLATEALTLLGHSQGGDVLLTTLAVAGENARVAPPIAAASIWAGNIADRFTQANTFGPMGSSAEAFLAGDGSWTRSAVGRDGSINRDFVFAWPPHWMSSSAPSGPDWPGQDGAWAAPDVASALDNKYAEMYQTINRYVRDIDDASYAIHRDDEGALRITHDPRVAAVMPQIGGYQETAHIRQPLHLHFSDRDYYSLVEWNQRLAERINSSGGSARAFEYPGTTHSLRVSRHRWFSPAGTRDGVSRALQRDVALFRDRLQPPGDVP